jgi:hypothetical protein
MNRHHRTAFGIGISIMFLMLVFPPWTMSITPVGGGGTSGVVDQAVGYHWLFLPPEFQGSWRLSYSITVIYAHHIDVTRLIIQEFSVVLLLGGLALLHRGSIQTR